MTNDEVRRYAQDTMAQHDPANQDGHGYERCELCNFTRHPCDVYELAGLLLELLNRGERGSHTACWVCRQVLATGEAHTYHGDGCPLRHAPWSTGGTPCADETGCGEDCHPTCCPSCQARSL